MHAISRKPLQGVLNIIRFNWHFYALTVGLVIITTILFYNVPTISAGPLLVLAGLGSLGMVTSLIVSCYIYDCSGLYTLDWLPNENTSRPTRIINIHAGFDETSALIANRYPESQLRVLDFYDPALHTEISVRRARQAYPPYPGTESADTKNLALAEHSADLILGLFSFHEIRDRRERIDFLRQLRQALTEEGTIIIAEHLRDMPNALAYNIGCFHFLPAHEWMATFAAAGLRIKQQISVTPFITVFTLTHDDGAAS